MLSHYQKSAFGAYLFVLVGSEGSSLRAPSARMMVLPDGKSIGMISAGCVDHELIEAGVELLTRNEAFGKSFDLRGSDGGLEAYRSSCPGVLHVRGVPLSPGMGLDELESWLGLPGLRARSQSLQFKDLSFTEQILARVCLVVFGAGPDSAAALPIWEDAGWSVNVFDHRPYWLETVGARTARVLSYTDQWPDLSSWQSAERLALLLMTHDDERDLSLLAAYRSLPWRYVGAMAGRSRAKHLRAELQKRALDQIYGPIFHAPMGARWQDPNPKLWGLGIGAELMDAMSPRHPAGPQS